MNVDNEAVPEKLVEACNGLVEDTLMAFGAAERQDLGPLLQARKVLETVCEAIQETTEWLKPTETKVVLSPKTFRDDDLNKGKLSYFSARVQVRGFLHFTLVVLKTKELRFQVRLHNSIKKFRKWDPASRLSFEELVDAFGNQIGHGLTRPRADRLQNYLRNPKDRNDIVWEVDCTDHVTGARQTELAALMHNVANNAESLHKFIEDLPRVTIVPPGHVFVEWAAKLEPTGYRFDAVFVNEFEAAIGAKPFVILSGISGTGKTQLARLWAVWDVLGLEKNTEKQSRPLDELYRDAQETKRYAFVPVRPDWTDAKGALGFYNHLHKKYEATPLLKVLLHAQEDESPHYLILDEMNLARVEYYFSDLLSAMESRDEPVSLHTQNEARAADESAIPKTIMIPEHVRIIGTVNVDETTYAFAPKVLDRAFVLEFGMAEDDYSRYLDSQSDVPDEFRAFVIQVAGILTTVNMHFGYRVMNEMLAFLVERGAAIDTALDFLLLSKVLPKVRGEGSELEDALRKLLNFCCSGNPGEAGDEGSPKYPRAAKKAKRMLSDAISKGFVSYLT